jgi:outer membrane protein assembly factor BamB
VFTTKPVARGQTATIPKKWQFTATGAITGGLALGDDGTLYAASEDGFVYALDSSGSLQWKFNAGPMLAGPTIDTDGTIYVSNKEEGAGRNHLRRFARRQHRGVRWSAWGTNA